MRKSVLLTGVAAVLTLALAGTAPVAKAQDLIFLSTQLRPIDEAQKVRDVILKGAPKTSYVVDEPSPFTVRMKVEVEAKTSTRSALSVRCTANCSPCCRWARLSRSTMWLPA